MNIPTATLLHCLAFAISLGCTPHQSKSSDPFETTVSAVIEAFRTQNSQAINTLIAPELGLTVLYRMGVFDHYSTIQEFHFEKPTPHYLPYPMIDTIATLQYGTLPLFDCGEMIWDKTGLYCDTSINDNKLLQTAQHLIHYRGDTIPNEILNDFTKIGQTSRRIVLATVSGGELIFNLTWHQKRWYLTLIDQVTTDCSA